MKLKNSGLFREQGYIGGKWCDADSGETSEVTNPATGEVIGTTPMMGAAETDRAIAAADGAFADWRARTAKNRAKILKKWFDLIVANAGDLAVIMTTEQGKPLAEARGEVLYGAAFIEWFAEEGRRAYGDIIPAHMSDKRILVMKQPIGVVASITPWNFPSAMLTRKAAPALAAGCPVVAKPAHETPYSALALAVLAEEAGLPAGLFNVITGKASVIGKAMTDSKIVQKLTFTGSTEVGRILMRQCADSIKKVGLELGGNAPFIVFDDADIDAAVEGAIMCKYRNSGQTCVCANRIYVQDKVYDAFLEKFVAKVAGIKVGDGMAKGTTQGPLITDDAVEKVEEHIADGIKRGGKVLIGGKRHELGGKFFEPTVIAEASDDMMCATEETFGPMAPVFKFKTEEEVIERANNTNFGLAAYFYARDVGRIFRVSEALDSGIVGVNTGIISTEVAPFGGIKQSGIGREGSKYGLEDFLEIKYVCLGI
ncbi:MAG: NAD-dependent succinate-semialdehyde dehydrogenase [Alphaproteobacteria bacterium]